jgi:hypothetical protein
MSTKSNNKIWLPDATANVRSSFARAIPKIGPDTGTITDGAAAPPAPSGPDPLSSEVFITRNPKHGDLSDQNHIHRRLGVKNGKKNLASSDVKWRKSVPNRQNGSTFVLNLQVEGPNKTS